MEANRRSPDAGWALDSVDAGGVIFTLLLVVVWSRAVGLESWLVAPCAGGLALAIPAARRRWLGAPRGSVRASGTAVDFIAAFSISLGVLVAATAGWLLVRRRGELYLDLGDTELIFIGACSVPCVLIGHLIDRRQTHRASAMKR